MTDQTRSPLLHPDWQHIDKISLEDFSTQDWALLNTQRAVYYREQQARQILRMLADQEHDGRAQQLDDRDEGLKSRAERESLDFVRFEDSAEELSDPLPPYILGREAKRAREQALLQESARVDGEQEGLRILIADQNQFVTGEDW